MKYFIAEIKGALYCNCTRNVPLFIVGLLPWTHMDMDTGHGTLLTVPVGGVCNYYKQQPTGQWPNKILGIINYSLAPPHSKHRDRPIL